MLSLRLVSVLICIVLIAVTAVLTLSVSLTFTQRAVNDIGNRYADVLATNLRADLQTFVQTEVDEYFALAVTYRRTPRQFPNNSYLGSWNGSFWTFNNVSALNFLLPEIDGMLQIGYANNFSRDLSALLCYNDGTFLRASTYDSALPSQSWIPKGPNPYDGSIIYTGVTLGKPGGAPIGSTPATYSYLMIRNLYLATGMPYTPIPISPATPPTPTPWSLPVAQCDPGQACHTTDCRTRPYAVAVKSMGPRRCVWYPLSISVRTTMQTGISCTLFNSAGLRLGSISSATSLDQISAFASRTPRTANSQVFVVDAADSGLLGSTYPETFTTFWQYSNATYVAATNSFVNNSLNPITFAAGFDGASFANATYAVVRPNCLVGTSSLGQFVGCRKTIDMYGYEPLRALYHTFGVDPVGGSAQGQLRTGGATYFYAMKSIRTYADNQLVGGLRWTSVVLTPEADILGEVVKGRSYSIVATCCFFVFAAACCYVLFAVFLAPLEGLEGKMEATANLADDDDKDESLSSLKEVRGMQTSFYKLRGQIRKLKTFVPQSVLASLYNDGDEEEEEEAVAVKSAGGTDASAQGTASHSSRHNDTRSISSARSAKSAKSAKGSTAQSYASSGSTERTLNMTLGLTKRSVTIMVFNIFGLHKFAKDRSVEELQRVHSKLLDAFSTVVTQGKGVVDSFQGDRFVATFNAVTRNAQHATRAAVAAAEIIAAFGKHRGGLHRAAVGVATGEALVGNAGTESQRRFCTIGRVYTHATVLERLTKQHASADVLLTHTAACAVAHDFYTEVLDCVALEGSSRPVLLHALRTRKNHAMEEWNYAMAMSEAKDLYSAANEAWMKYVDGDAVAARALLADSASTEQPGASKLQTLLAANALAANHAAAAQGPFFAASFGDASRPGPL